MNESERRRMWENYPSVPNKISESKREIKDIRDVSIECHNMDCSCLKYLKKQSQLTTDQNIYDI